MLSLDNVPWRSSADVESFFAEFVVRCRPVVLRGLFDDQPIRALDTLATAVARLGDMELAISGNFVVERLKGRVPERRTLSLAQYTEYVAAHPETRDYCYLEGLPRALHELIRAPALCERRSKNDTLALMFLGNAGNYSHLHYDEDLRDVLMYQVFGRKRYVMMDPSAADRLDPLFGPGLARTSGVCLQHMTDTEQRDFLHYVGAWDVVLAPGETLLMPFGCWHYVEYLDTALSLNFRMSRSAPVKALSTLMPQPSVFMQAIARCYADDRSTSPEAHEAFGKLMASGDGDDAALHAAVLEAYDTLIAGAVRPHSLRFSDLRRAIVRQPR